MTSLRHRTLGLVLGLLVLGTLTISLYNFHDTGHEITEIYDAQLAQSARLLQGVVQMPLPDKQREQLYHAFNAALSQAGQHRIGHPYEGKMAFQVWDRQGTSLFHSASARAAAHKPRVFRPDDRWRGLAWVSVAGHTTWPADLGRGTR